MTDEQALLRDGICAVVKLFDGGPETSCRTTWRDGVECIEVPLNELRDALDGIKARLHGSGMTTRTRSGKD